jgi:hypothetical protein
MVTTRIMRLTPKAHFGEGLGKVVDFSPIIRTAVVVDAILGDGTFDPDILGIRDFDFAAVFFREGTLTARAGIQRVIPHLVDLLRGWAMGTAGGARLSTRPFLTLSAMGLLVGRDGGGWCVFSAWPAAFEFS